MQCSVNIASSRPALHCQLAPLVNRAAAAAPKMYRSVLQGIVARDNFPETQIIAKGTR